MSNESETITPSSESRVLVAVTDIFFYSKIRDVLKKLGLKPERARSQQDITEKAESLQPQAIVLNMNDDQMNAMQALKDLKGAESTGSIPVLAFANHEEVNTFRQAQELGITKIVSRNEFSARTGDLVTETIGTKQP